MGARGPRKKLPELNRLDGSPGKRGGSDLPDFGIEAVGDVFIPDHLHEDAQGCIEVIRGSMPPKLYAKVDSFILSAFATAWAVHKQATHEISAPGFDWIVTSERGNQQPNPWLRILDKQATLLASLGDRLGLNPRARADLKLPAEKPASKFDGLIGLPGSSGLSKH
ncbi:P27 family phage terminase small subunit [uncultured Enterovirga sp.]|uniref:P27 family phage terminase small subunit n=1 Tax=uncultured Enterovirga sp. TaxID=2026352 RepID=UPI0035CA7344